MDLTNTAGIALDSATDDLADVQASAAELVAASAPASEWSSFTVRLAAAEGSVAAWSKLVQVMARVEGNGSEVSSALVTSVALSLMSAGADDSWSGRGNDVQRARFDGVRAACQQMSFL